MMIPDDSWKVNYTLRLILIPTKIPNIQKKFILIGRAVTE